MRISIENKSLKKQALLYILDLYSSIATFGSSYHTCYPQGDIKGDI